MRSCLISYSRSQVDDPRPTTPEDVVEGNRTKTTTEDIDEGNRTKTTTEDDDDDGNNEFLERLRGEIFPLQRRRTCPPGLLGGRCPPRPTRPGQHPQD
ncbi:hypothetical protein AVEN_66645-2 [Araneus ventricosus]|uniref:Uncharacterized protein n=1 Tax=Araneus ventricosus TaxID=182803 RepID=A0A4Y2M6G2_ARAVE|nr:hypothetical protein AVEN_66645-2 [Araneus ventricosus]